MMLLFLALQLFCSPARATDQAGVFALTLAAAERETLATSNLLSSYVADEDAASENANAQFQNLLPKLSLQGSFQYYAAIPQVSFLPGSSIPFGTNSVYTVGPQLNYTLWDTFSARDSYLASDFMRQARTEDRKNTEVQLLASVRNAYVQVQLGIEELVLINSSLNLALAENRDVMNKFHAGSADRLDVVTSQRSVLGYRIQFEQRQAQLSSALKDLLHLIGKKGLGDTSHPGPVGVPGTTLALELDPLRKLLTELSPPGGTIPGNDQPQIRSQEFQARSYEESAKSQSARVFPTLQVGASVSEIRPDVPNPPSFLQETVGVTLSMPLYLGDPSSSLAAEQRRQSDSADFRAAQLKDDIARDFAKAREELLSLRVQSELATRDVAQSEEEARLYFTSYKAGKINFIDVQNANNQALTAKVSSARIDAQILAQTITLLSLSGEDSAHGN